MAEEQEQNNEQEQSSGNITTNYLSGFNNDILEKCRADSNKQYHNAAYNYFKYLNSSFLITNVLLNLVIDIASAKAELCKLGVNIFEQTPPPDPTPNNVDDNYNATGTTQKKVQDAIAAQGKDSVRAGGTPTGTGGTSTSNGSGTTAKGTGDSGLYDNEKAPIGSGAGLGVENIPADAEDWVKNMCLQCSQKCGIPADWLYAQWRIESENFQNPPNDHNYGCVRAEGGGWMSFDSPEDWADYFARYIRLWNNPASTAAKNIDDYFYNIQHQNNGQAYCPDQNREIYGDICKACLPGKITVLQ